MFFIILLYFPCSDTFQCPTWLGALAAQLGVSINALQVCAQSRGSVALTLSGAQSTLTAPVSALMDAVRAGTARVGNANIVSATDANGNAVTGPSSGGGVPL